MRPCAIIRAIFLAASGFTAASAARADVLTLEASKDATIFQNNADNSDGGGAGLFAGTNGTGSPRRALIAFDFGSIPSGATITAVQFTMTLGLVPAGSAFTTATIGLFSLQHDWGQSTNGSTSGGISGSGQGAAAQPGDATWNAAFYSASTPTLWATPGGAHAAVASSSLFLDNNTLNNSFTWLSTSRLVADVQGWVNNPSSNFGWEIQNADEVASRTLYGFYSSEWHDFTGGNAAQEPSLQVTFAVPEPCVGALVAAGVPAWLARRRRTGRGIRAQGCGPARSGCSPRAVRAFSD